MSDSVWVEAVKQVPAMAVLAFVIIVFLNHLEKTDDKRMAHDKDMEHIRIEAAKERETERRAHELILSNMQAQNMKSLIENIASSSEKIADALEDHEAASKDRYEKMGITKDLLDAAKERERELRQRKD